MNRNERIKAKRKFIVLIVPNALRSTFSLGEDATDIAFVDLLD